MGGFDVLLDEAQAGCDQTGELISIAVSTCNHADQLWECLDSLAEQTHGRIELIVVDDMSQDDSCLRASHWMERCGARFQRCRLLRQRNAQGWAMSRNLAFEAAECNAVFVLDGDHRIFPRALARLHETMVDTGAAVTYSHRVYFGDAQGVDPAADWDAAAFLQRDGVGAMALVDRRAWAAVGGYVFAERGWEHYDLWCKFMEAELYGVLVPELLCARRDSSRSPSVALAADARRRLVYRMLSAHPWLELRV